MLATNFYGRIRSFLQTIRFCSTGAPDKLYKLIDVECKGHDSAVLKSYENFALQTAKLFDVEILKIWQPRYIWWMRTLLRSVHVHKKQRVQYETRTHFRCWQLRHVTGSTADTYLEYIQRNLPEGVGMKVTKQELLSLPEHIQPPKKSSPDAENESETKFAN